MRPWELRKLAGEIAVKGSQFALLARGERNARTARVLRRVVSHLEIIEVALHEEADEAPLFEGEGT